MTSQGGDELEILFVEDSEDDAHLIARELTRYGFAPSWERVETADALRDALHRRPWRVVISDSSLPQLGAFEALQVTRSVDPMMPFIVVSGSFTAEHGRAAVDAGAADWIGKDALERLGPTVQRELERRRAPDAGTVGQRLLAAQEAERRNIARALHDELGQVLTALRLTLEAAERGRGIVRTRKLGEALLLVDQGVAQLRAVAVGLWPTVLDDLGLPAALRWLAERDGRPEHMVIDVVADDVGRLPSPIEVACFRLVQEALTNASRHSGAQHLEVRLHSSADTLTVEVRDDGQGFDSATAWRRAAAGASLGLLGMRERVALAGGTLDVESQPGEGTIVRARFPLGGESST